ncbi:unnamed protein product [Mytilus coruscus]|uniref:TIR domain-containing protein n=1 Tax=Mytilus coruscus TaxID=42192 RepID=A0A6J8DRP9_MYTCO|nr:unnamed protein product [Mytilus coruscus]
MWSERFDNVCRENSSLTSVLEEKNKALQKVTAQNKGLRRERVELLARLDVKERERYMKTCSRSSDDHYSNYTPAEIEFLLLFGDSKSVHHVKMFLDTCQLLKFRILYLYKIMADAMERGYSYDAMFLYNKPKLTSNRYQNPDHVLSFNVVKFAVDKMATWGFDNSYYHERNATPGSYIFDEFFETVEASRFIVVLCTKGFLTDSWGKYTSHAAFAKLLDKNDSKRFIALHIGLKDQQIPAAFNTMIGLSFSANWQNENEEWEKFKNILVKVKQPVHDTGVDVVPLIQAISGSQNPTNRGNHQHPQTGHVGIQAISGIEIDGEPNEPSETNSKLQSVNQNTTNRSDNGNPLNQQSGGGNQHNLDEMQSNDSSVIYQRNSTNGLDSNKSATVSITTNTATKSTTTASQNTENNQSTTKTGVGLTSSVATPPNTVVSTIGNSMEENIILTQKAQAVASTSTTMKTSGTTAQAVASTSTTMQTSASREPPDGAATLTNSQNSSDTNSKNVVGRDNDDEDYIFSSLNRNDVIPDNSDQSISNSTENQLSTDSLIKKSHFCPLPPEQLVRPKDERLNSHHDSGYAPSMDLHVVVSDHQETNGFNTSSIGTNRPNANSGALLTNNRYGYKSINESAINSRGN